MCITSTGMCLIGMWMCITGIRMCKIDIERCIANLWMYIIGIGRCLHRRTRRGVGNCPPRFGEKLGIFRAKP